MPVLPRVAVLIPSTDTTVEVELPQHLAGVATCHFTRMALGSVTEQGLRAMAEDALVAARTLAVLRPAVLVYACTSGTFVLGREHEATLTGALRDIVGCPVVTTAGAVVTELLVRGGAVRLRTPYEPSLTDAEAAYFEGAGLHVVSRDSLGITVDDDIAAVDLARLRGFVAGDDGAAQVMLSCTNLRTAGIHAVLETAAGLPVVTSNGSTAAEVRRRLAA